VGARLILVTAMMIGLLLVADDLVLRTPGVVSAALASAREHAPNIRLRGFRFPELPKLPALPKFVTRDAVKAKRRNGDDAEEEENAVKSKVMLKREKEVAKAQAEAETIELKDDEEAELPDADEQAVAVIKPPPQIRKDIIVKLPNMLKPRQVS